MFVTLFLCALGTEVIGDIPRPSKKPSAAEPIPGIARMNPYYLGISAAVLANDSKALSGYVKDLEKIASSHPENWMDAMCARLYVLEKLDDRDGFSQAMAEFCARKLSDKRSAERKQKFVTSTLLTLRLNNKIEWVKSASEAIWPVLGPEPDPLLVLILRNRLENIPQYPEKARLLADTIEKAAKSLQEHSSNNPLQSSWASGMEELCYLSIRNHFVVMKLEQLISEVTAYLDKYGKDGRHAAEVYYLLLKALNLYYTKIIAHTMTLIEAPSQDWLRRWQQAFTVQKGGTWTKQITEEWTKWENGAKAREELVRQPRKNPNLQVRLSLNLKRPTIKDFFIRLNTASGLQFTTAENIPTDRIVCESFVTHQVHAWTLMDRIEKAVVSEGQWIPIMEGHKVAGYQLTGILKPLPPFLLAKAVPSEPPSPAVPDNRLLRNLLSIISLLAILGITFLIRRRRHAQARPLGGGQ